MIPFPPMHRWLPRIVAAAVAVAALVGIRTATACPDCGALVSDLRSRPAFDEALTLYDRHDSAVAVVGGEKRFGVPLAAMPTLLRDAWVAVEDRRFRDHSGVDALGVARAALVNLRAGEVREGASTIAMQVVRIVWKDRVKTLSPWERKAFEARMAPRLVERLGHDAVLELYLNGLYLGEGVYGAAAAARHYFGRDVGDLNVGQIATLVGLGKTPGRYNPRLHPERARQRRDIVLARMLGAGLISQSDHDAAVARPVETIEQPPVSYRRSWFTAAVRRELRRVAPELVGRPGLRVFTTIDPGMQTRADSVVKAHLAAVEAGEFGPRATPDAAVEASLIAIDSRSGAVRAVVGGRSFDDSPLDRAIQTRRQVGSLAKPLLLATALEHGFPETRRVSTGALTLQTIGGPWSPADHVAEAELLPTDVVVRSSNRAAVRIGESVGAARFVESLRRFGVGRDARPYPSAYLGSFEASLAEITAAFAPFENGGSRIEPHLIRRIEDGTGRVLWSRPPSSPRPLLRASTAFLVQSALRDVVDRGTGWRVRRVLGADAPAAGKTGTSNDGRDLWFAGSRPGLAVGVWMGHDTPAPVVHSGSGGTLAAPLWASFVDGLPTFDPGLVGDGSWEPPETVRAAALDASGRVVPADCAVGGAARRIWVARERAVAALSPCAPTLRATERSTDRLQMDLAPVRIRPLAGSLAAAGSRTEGHRPEMKP